MRKPDWENDGVSLYLGDCLEILPTLKAGSVDAVITDPPYPDYHQELYGAVDIGFLNDYSCRQFVFWSAKVDFPLDYTAIHIWDKARGCGSTYERIFERNGHNNWLLFRALSINSRIAAGWMHDQFTGHPSQKPQQLMTKIIEKFTRPGTTILDPFMGSGTTGVACVQTGRDFIGIEIDPGYFDIAKKRIIQAQSTPRLPGVR